MKDRPAQSTKRTKTVVDGLSLGRSGATGRMVLKPASKHASITVERAIRAADSVHRGKR